MFWYLIILLPPLLFSAGPRLRCHGGHLACEHHVFCAWNHVYCFLPQYHSRVLSLWVPVPWQILPLNQLRKICMATNIRTNVWMPCMLNLILQFVIACMKWCVVNIPYYCVIVYCLLMLPLASCHGNCCVTMYSSSLSFLQSSYPERLLWFARQLFLQPQLWLPSVSRLLKVRITSTALIHISVRCVYSIWLYNVLCLSVAWSM